jgi:glycosyltransferase involved in cell wall biosynthesis
VSSPKGSNGPLLFLISALVPYPPARGVELRIFRLLKWLRSAGYRVVLIVPADSLDAEVERELRKVTYALHWTKPALRTRLGARFPAIRRALWEPTKTLLGLRGKTPSSTADSGQHPAGDSGLKESFAPGRLISLVERLGHRYQPIAAIVEYIFSTPVLAALPASTLKIVDTIDVFSRKEEQVLTFGIRDPLVCTADEERQYLLQADVILAIQSREAQLLRELAPEREIVLAGMDFDVIDTSNTNQTEPASVAVLASDNALNIHGLNAFLAECWPSIKRSIPGVSLVIAGRVGDHCIVEDASVRYTGWTDDVDQIYREASVIINPTIAGTGLKIKSVQALAHGKPLVAWANGVEGLEYVGEPPFIECRSWQEYAEAIVRLLNSADERQRLGERARSYARREFSADKVYAALAERLSQAQPATRRRDRNSSPLATVPSTT